MHAGLGGSNAGPTGDQEVVGATPAGLATFFRGGLICYSHSLQLIELAQW